MDKELTLSKGAFFGLHYFSPNQGSGKTEREDADTGYIEQGIQGRHQTSERIYFCGIISPSPLYHFQGVDLRLFIVSQGIINNLVLSRYKNEYPFCLVDV